MFPKGDPPLAAKELVVSGTPFPDAPLLSPPRPQGEDGACPSPPLGPEPPATKVLFGTDPPPPPSQPPPYANTELQQSPPPAPPPAPATSKAFEGEVAVQEAERPMHTADEPPPAAPPTVESPPDDQPAPPVAFPELLEVGALQPTIALTVVFGLTGNSLRIQPPGPPLAPLPPKVPVELPPKPPATEVTMAFTPSGTLVEWRCHMTWRATSRSASLLVARSQWSVFLWTRS